MDKNSNIAEIIAHLNDLNLNETQEILNYIKNRENSKKKSTNNSICKGSDGKSLSVGDRVSLLTPGKLHNIFEEAYIEQLPIRKGSYLKLTLARHQSRGDRPIIRKLPKNVKLIELESDSQSE